MVTLNAWVHTIVQPQVVVPGAGKGSVSTEFPAEDAVRPNDCNPNGHKLDSRTLNPGIANLTMKSPCTLDEAWATINWAGALASSRG